MTLSKCQPVYQKIGRILSGSICVTCGNRKVKDGGHFMPKKQYPRLSMLVMNIHGQCGYCNFYAFGEQWRMGCYIESEFGMGYKLGDLAKKGRPYRKRELEFAYDWGVSILGIIENTEMDLGVLRIFIHEWQMELPIFR